MSDGKIKKIRYASGICYIVGLAFSRYKKTDKVPELGEENSKELEN